MIVKLILKLTHRMWNRRISGILCRAYSDRVINSEQLHALSSAFDPTQNHMVYTISSFRDRQRPQKE